MKKCESCGRSKKEDGEKYCSHCVDGSGDLLSYGKVTKNLAEYLIETQGLADSSATNAARAITSSQPAWNKKQGVYFESDMKKRKNIIIALFVALAVVLVGSGLWIWNNQAGSVEVESYLFENGENYEITRMVGDVEVHELDAPGEQFNSQTLFHNKNIFCFSSYEQNENVSLEKQRVYVYDIDKKKGVVVTRYHSKLMSDYGGAYEGVIFEFFWDDGWTKLDILNTSVLKESNDMGNSEFEYIAHRKMNNVVNIDNSNRLSWDYDDYSYVQFIFANRMCEDRVGNYVPNERNIFLWIEEFEHHTTSGSAKIFARNLKTDRTKLITDTLAIKQSRITFSGSIISWVDNRDINSNKFKTYYYNLDTDEEIFIEDDQDKGLLLQNDRYIFFIGTKAKTYSKEYLKEYENDRVTGLYVFDTKTNIMSKITDNAPIFIEHPEYEGEWRRGAYAGAPIFISNASSPENSFVVWSEKQGEDIDSLKILYQSMSNLDNDPIELVLPNQGENTIKQIPVYISSTMLVWETFDKKHNSILFGQARYLKMG